MNLEKFTERSREFIQSAQAAALAAEHQRILPQHHLKVILEDEQDFAKNLLKKIGVDSHKILVDLDLLLSKIPKIKSKIIINKKLPLKDLVFFSRLALQFYDLCK